MYGIRLRRDSRPSNVLGRPVPDVKGKSAFKGSHIRPTSRSLRRYRALRRSPGKLLPLETLRPRLDFRPVGVRLAFGGFSRRRTARRISPPRHLWPQDHLTAGSAAAGCSRPPQVLPTDRFASSPEWTVGPRDQPCKTIFKTRKPAEGRPPAPNGRRRS